MRKLDVLSVRSLFTVAHVLFCFYLIPVFPVLEVSQTLFTKLAGEKGAGVIRAKSGGSGFELSLRNCFKLSKK